MHFHQAVSGRPVIADDMMAKLVAQMRRPIVSPAPPENAADTLTPRVLDILRDLARSASNKEIARELDITESTVKMQRRRGTHEAMKNAHGMPWALIKLL